MGINLILIRALSKQDYAYFTIANTMLFTLLVLSDSGISSGLSAIGGRIWSRKDKLGELVRTAITLRKKLALGSIVVVIPILYLMLYQNGIDTFQGILICLFVIVGAFFQLESSIYSMVLKLNNQFDKLAQIDLVNILLKLAGIGLLSIIAMINAPLSVLAISIPLAYNYYLSKKKSANYIVKTEYINPIYSAEVKRLITKKLPTTVYYCISGQIGIFLISFFGSASSVAEVGALGRLAMVVSVLTIVINNVIAPTYAKINSKLKIKFYYIGLAGCIATVTFFSVSISSFWPKQILWILGGDYNNLASVLPLVILSAFINANNLAMSNLNASKGWIVNPLIYIPSHIITQVIGIALFDISTVKGVVNLQLLSNVVLFGIHWTVFYIGLKSFKEVS